MRKVHTGQTLRDSDIRKPLHRWLWEQHAQTEDTAILHELPIPRPSARMDIAVVNGEICGFEIKSDADRLTRLRYQQPAFSAICDKICLVVTSRHLKQSRTAIPQWWGIVLVQHSDGGVIFRSKRKPRENRTPNNRALLYLLTRAELKMILSAKGVSKLPQSDLIEMAITTLDAAELRGRVREILKRRPTFSYPSSSSLPAPGG